jgi:soluble lytic murein transglycosylase-like protein
MKKIAALIAIVFIIFSYFLTIPKDKKLEYSINHPDVIKVERMIDKLERVHPKLKKTIALAIVSNGSYYKVDYRHLVAIGYVESQFRPDVISSKNSYGLWQINWDVWGKKFAKDKHELFNVYKNSEIACKILVYNRSIGYDKLHDYYSLCNNDVKTEYALRIKNALRRI